MKNLMAMVLLLSGLLSLAKGEGVFERFKGEEALTDKVVLIKVGENDLMNPRSFDFWKRILERANSEKARAVVFELHTPGGAAFPTVELITEEMRELDVPSFALVNNKAISAGAMIAMGTDHIYMVPNSLIGSAGIITMGGEMDEVTRAKAESVFDAYMQTVATDKGRNIKVIRAMMFRDEENARELGSVTVRKGALLTLTAAQAVEDIEGEPLLAKGIVKDLDALIEAEGLQDFEVVVPERSGFEKMAWTILFISPILIAVGMAAGYLEFQSPGFGVGGIVAIIAFTLFFFGNFVAGRLAGYEMLAIFVIGIALIAVEIFVLPSFGIAGLLGAGMVVISLLLSMVDLSDWDGFNTDAVDAPNLVEVLRVPIYSLFAGLVGGSVLIALLMRYVPELSFMKKLMVPATVGMGTGIIEKLESGERIGQAGSAETDLRPSGKAMIDGKIVDVVAEGEFVLKGERVRIIKEDGMGVVVKKVSIE